MDTTIIYWILGLLVFLIVLDYFFKKKINEKNTETLLEKLRRKKVSFHHTLPKFKGTGIVIACNDQRILGTLLTITTIRNNGCNLPVLVTFAGEELNQYHQQRLKSLGNVGTIDLAKKLDLDPSFLQGYQIKLYSLIYSPFETVILINTDTLFLTNPEHLLQDPTFQESGLLLWKDCQRNNLWDKKVWEWVRKLVPYRKDENRILNKKSGSYSSGGVVMMHKPSHRKTLEKLLLLAKNWGFVGDYLDSDKEYYWIAAELAGQPYTFVSSYPGAIGENGIDAICGHVLHLDNYSRPCWINNSTPYQPTDFQYLALDGEWGIAGTCLKKTEKIEISNDLRNYLNVCNKLTSDITTELALDAQKFE